MGTAALHRSITAPDLSETQRQELGRYLSYYRDETVREPLRLALMIAGDKPATLVAPEPWITLRSPLTFSNGSVELFNVFDLASREIRDVPAWFVARSSGRLDLLPTVRNGDCDAYHRRLGVIFGYPPREIDSYITHEGERTRPDDFVEAGVFTPEEMAYAEFVFYMSDDSEEGYTRAIAAGKRTYERLTELADYWHLPDLQTIADSLYEYQVEKYSTDSE